MEQSNRVNSSGIKRPVWMPESVFDKLSVYADMIHSSNSDFNLTGHKTPLLILEKLLIDSVLPFKDAYVPRGTCVLDIGCGAGIPGVPFSVFFSGAEVFLVDSNEKKISFVRDAVSSIGIEDVEAYVGRIEDIYKNYKWFEKFDLVLSRAVANPYIISEYSSGLIKIGGYLYLYSSTGLSSHPRETLMHIESLGLREADDVSRSSIGVEGGILLKKIAASPENYPRRFAVIKRISDRLYADN